MENGKVVMEVPGNRVFKNLNLTILSNRRKVAPFGLKGGTNGKRGKNYLKQKNQLSCYPHLVK